MPWPLCAGMVAQFAAGGAVIPFVTLLFRDRGLSLGQISTIFVASSATLLISPLFWGMLADRFIPLNRLFAIINVLVCATLLSIRGEQSAAELTLKYTCYFACFNPTLYLMNALSFHHLSNPREQFGRLRAWGSVGWILPFLPISLWLAWTGKTDLEFVLYVGMVCSLIMVGASFCFPHTPPGGRRRGPGRPAAYGIAMLRLLSDANYLVLLLSMFLIAGSFSLFTYYSPPRLEDCGIPRLWIGPVQAIAVIAEIILFQWQPALLRRWNYATVSVIGCVALAVRHVLFGLIDRPWVLAGSYVLAAVVIVFFYQSVSILVNTMATKEVRATAQTLLLLAGQGLGPLFANALTGRLAAFSGGNLRLVFLFAALLSGLAALLLVVRGRHLNAAGGPDGTSLGSR